LKQAAQTLDTILAPQPSPETRTTIPEPHTSRSAQDIAHWTKDAKESLSGAAAEYYKSKKEAVSAIQHEKEAQKTTGQEKEEHLKLAAEAREDQSAHVSNAHQHLDNLHPRKPGTPVTVSQPKPSKPSEESVFSRISNWFSGK